MAAHVLRLRLDLLLGPLRGGRRDRVRALTALLLTAVATGAALWGLLRLPEAPDDIAFAVIVVGGAAVTAGFLLFPLFGGADDPLDPRRFAVFGLAASPLAAAVFLAGLVSIPILAVLVASAGVVVLGDERGVPIAAVVASVLLGAVTCALFARIAFAVGARVLRPRRTRELTGLVLVGVVVVVVPTIVFLASLPWAQGVPPQLREAVNILAITPFGAAWAFPWRAAAGEFGASLAVALVTLAVLAALWWALVRWMVTTTERPLTARTQRGLGWFAVTPGTPSGAIAARSLIYWLRDPRYLVNVVVVPISAVLAMVPLLVVGVTPAVAMLLPAPIMALFFGWLAHNDLAYDSTALWMHVASGVRGAADRLGRLVPITLISLPLLALAVPLTVWQHGRWAVLPAMAGVCASLFLTGLGLSSISSVAAPYAVSRPGDGPFEQPQRTGGALAQGMVLVGALVLSIPALWWGWLALGADDDSFAWTAFWGGIGIGLFVLVVGVLAGGWAFDRRGSRLMEFVEST